ncbi:hypothetical protein GCM10008967_07750 [Bacillus carboniphilus]|uniref:SLH domain-containing protein n=1 Tax=Bacillus carboniphilus TaxID=86663 RepID=A0ABN0VXF1_9BACI
MKKLGLVSLTAMALIIPSTSGFAAVDANCGEGNGEVTCLQVPVKDLATEEKAYQFLQEHYIFYGYADGEAHLDRLTNRAQVAVTLQRMFSLQAPTKLADGPNPNPYKDLAYHWAADDIHAVHEAGWMKYDGEEFKPNQTITLQELAEILVRVAELNTGEYASIWLPADSEYQDDLAAALTEKLIRGSDDYKAEATRGDLAFALNQLYHYMLEKEPSSVMSALVPSLKVEQTDDNWSWTFDIKNQSEDVQTVAFSSGLNFDYILYKDGKKVEQYSDGKFFIMIYKEQEVGKGEGLNYKGVFSDLEPGEYTLETWLVAKGWPQVRDKVSFIVEE